MRLRRQDRFLLFLAVLFLLAVLRRTDLPGEEVIPDAYRATIHRHILAPAAGALAEDELELVELRSELEAKKQEVRQLKEQLAATRELSKYFATLEWEKLPEAIPGWVVAVDTDLFRRTLTIDRGTAQGIGPGLPVVNGKALLGIVVLSRKRVSVVRRVDDPVFRLEVEIETAEGAVRGVARGDGSRGLDIRFVRRADALSKGDAVFTSRYHEDIPPGLVVGWVETVDDLDQDGIQEVTVTPAAALGRWAQIEVLKRRR